jgi:alcohol dehydrogenase YqhD (iron-dependent ADH family)
MENFIYDIPTKIAFGKGQIEMLPKFIKEYGSKVLLVYGGGSIKKIGIYQEAVALLEENNIPYCELSGVEQNPQIETVKKGVELCKTNEIEVIVPIGGGSTIDCAKAIAAGTFYDGDPWDIVKDNSLMTKALPIVAVLTVAATGSEMDSSSVISNAAECDKAEINGYMLYPKASILDPNYTCSVSAYHTAAGVADIMSHVFEYYFNGDEALDIQRGMMNSVLKTCVKYGVLAVKKPDNEKARANLMWAASWAINGFIASGANSSWQCHAMEYQLTNAYHVTHGHGMAIVNLAWMKYILSEETLPAFCEYAKEVFDIEEMDKEKAAMLAIEKTKELYESLGLSLTLRSIGATESDDLAEMAKRAVTECALDQAERMPLSIEDVTAIFQSCF